MFPRESALQEIIDAYTHQTITAGLRGANAVYKAVLGDEKAFNQICAETPLTFAPGLLRVLQSSSPPTTEFFQSLPVTPVTGFWAVYALLLEKPGAPSRLYIGSGTNTQRGVIARFWSYDVQLHVPTMVVSSLQEGYTVSRRGLLCWAPIPRATIVATARVRFLAVEAVFSHVFFAVNNATSLDAASKSFLPWTRASVAWEPLCTHTALKEKPVGNFSLTEEEAAAIDARRRERTREVSSKNSKIYRARGLAEDPIAYRAKIAATKLVWAQNNRDKYNERAAGVRARAIAARRHVCKVCDFVAASAHNLTKHLATKTHQEQVRLAAGGRPKAPSIAALRSRRNAAKALASKRFYCGVCDKNCNTQIHLNQHKESKVHLKAVAAAEAAVAAEALASSESCGFPESCDGSESCGSPESGGSPESDGFLEAFASLESPASAYSTTGP
ncbi:hypothetical protein BBK36DRAFT_1118290 [Trichoderma citrinoviride]|uniref:C2H2-type domain-containing protein n=1 Tax=Trichoderma citrinoviride TaxID=58853 RepID=A0A2T4BCU5_9HYPO|nr:hypothetical protein BBK36DRAFT_1118290 [Trichoderma citrinoviride]PTB67152.1 hypothetical protein BBK36DRAFT_1118290 [Trichoderma citrinoviride]